MIAKRVAINSNRKSNFAGLVEYMVDTKNKNERVEAVRISNCHSDNPSKKVLMLNYPCRYEPH